MELYELGSTGILLPRIVFGTSTLGNLYRTISDEDKLEIMRQWFQNVTPLVAIDTAGKYGAGLALEVIGRNLRELGISPDQVIISNKIGWKRTQMYGSEPTFEPGAWAGLQHDAQQHISYSGILECWEQGCELLGEDYRPALVSVHDPDEYLATADSTKDRQQRFADIVAAYEALAELKRSGITRAVGVGAKDWRVIQEIDNVIQLDWVMLANSLTIYRHPTELIQFVESLRQKGVGIINSAIFHGGFLVGGDFFDYRKLSPSNESDHRLFTWRDCFFKLCQQHNLTPAVACTQFVQSIPGITSIAVATSNPSRIAVQVADLTAKVPMDFWTEAKQAGLVAEALTFAE